jgi:DNA polymerase III epsilon subunit-like protein
MDNIILLDIETQDYSISSGIYEVAMFAVKNGNVVEQLVLENKIKNYKGTLKYGFGRHNISEDESYINKFKKFIEKYNYPIVAHNCPFDRGFLVAYNWIKEDYPCYCSMRAIRRANPNLNAYNLDYLCEYFGLSKTKRHTALGDVEVVFELLKINKPTEWLKVGQRAKKSVYAKKQKHRELDEIDLNIEKTHILEGEVVCFTGVSDYPRHTMEEITLLNGGLVSKSVTSKTTMLVVGQNAGSKLDKAQDNGISITSDHEFMERLNLINADILKE